MEHESIQKVAGSLDEQAAALYTRHGALPWDRLPEPTREHFRSLVRAGLDSAGRPLSG